MGFGTLARELGADPSRLLARFGITPAAEHEVDASIGFEPFVRLLEASAAQQVVPALVRSDPRQCSTEPRAGR